VFPVPADVKGPRLPVRNFRMLKTNEIRRFGSRTLMVVDRDRRSWHSLSAQLHGQCRLRIRNALPG
jgi:hypothetical protein